MTHPVDVHVGKRVRHRRWLIGMTQQQLKECVDRANEYLLKPKN